jgi:hypothetical protein
MVGWVASQVGALLRVLSILHLPIPKEGVQPVRMNATDVLDLYVELDRVVDAKVDP